MSDIEWACPRCGNPGYVLANVLRCGNHGCPNTHEYDPTTGERLDWVEGNVPITALESFRS